MLIRGGAVRSARAPGIRGNWRGEECRRRRLRRAGGHVWCAPPAAVRAAAAGEPPYSGSWPSSGNSLNASASARGSAESGICRG